MKLKRVEHSSEYFEYFIDGESVAYVNHDVHGWEGMKAVDSLFNRFAEHLSIEVEEGTTE